jgi:hypothetical protein
LLCAVAGAAASQPPATWRIEPLSPLTQATTALGTSAVFDLIATGPDW